MATIQLRDGATAEVPDGLEPDALESTANQAQAAYDAAHPQPAAAAPATAANAAAAATAPVSQPARPASGAVNPPGFWDKVNTFLQQTPVESAPEVDRALGGYPSAILSGINRATGGYAAPVGNMAANVAVDAATGIYDAPASISNVLYHTAQKYGYGVGEPDWPMAAPAFKEEFGITSPSNPYAQGAETLLDLAVGNKASGARLIPSLVSAGAQDVAQNVGSTVVGNIAKAFDPRLEEAGQTAGALLPGVAPKESIGSGAVRLFGGRGENAGEIYDQTRALGQATGNPDLMPTAGMVGSPGVGAFERSGAVIPLLNIPIKSAQTNVGTAVGRGVETAANRLAPPGTRPSTVPGAPGALLQQGAQDELTRQWQGAKGTIDTAESDASVHNLRDPNGNPVLVKGPALQSLFDDLGGLTSQTVNGRSFPVSIGSGGDAVGSVANRLRSVLMPQDPVLDRNLNVGLNNIRTRIADPNTPAALKPGLQASADNIQNQINNNMGVTFEALRRLKSETAANVDQGSVDSFTGNKMTDAMTNALQSHLDAANPALGQSYRTAVGQYKDAMDLKRGLTGPGAVNVVGTPQGPGQYANPPGETSVSNRVADLLRNPQRAGSLPQTPGWADAVAATVASLGQKGGQFTPGAFLNQWGSATPGGKALFTGSSPEARQLLDTSQNVAQALERQPQSTGGSENLGRSLASTAIAEHALGTMGAGKAALGGLGATLGLERPGTIRALAGRPAPYRRQISPLPALVAVAQAQARNQGYDF